LNKKREADASLGDFNFKRFFKPEWLFNTPSLYPYACPPSQPGGAFREPAPGAFGKESALLNLDLAISF
jgi:hypothetical protein